MYSLKWSGKELSRQKLGAFGEYCAKMALASYGMSIYTPEVDDHGIDFIAESENGFLKFQVKSIWKSSYVYLPKSTFDITDQSLFLILVRLKEGEVLGIYVIPATAWQENYGSLFTDHDYEGKKSSPEYGLNLSAKISPNLNRLPWRTG